MTRARLVVVVALLAAVSDASAVVLCEGKKHTVSARDACRRKEKVLALAGIGVVGGKGTGGATGAPGPPPLRAVDSTGADFGPITDTELYLLGVGDPFQPVTHALLQRSQLPAAVLVGIGLNGGLAGTVRYESPDCSGTPLVDGTGLMPTAQVVTDTLFVPGAVGVGGSPATSVETTDQSHGCESITARGGCCRTQSTPVTGYRQATTIPLATLGITPPLHAVLVAP